jgi:hypothetical protein
MTHSIDIETIVTMLGMVPKKYHTNNIAIAKGKYQLPKTLMERFKKIANGR